VPMPLRYGFDMIAMRFQSSIDRLVRSPPRSSLGFMNRQRDTGRGRDRGIFVVDGFCAIFVRSGGAAFAGLEIRIAANDSSTRGLSSNGTENRVKG
jgi:hypothetical protein